MRRGTTPIHVFAIPYSVKNAREIEITYKQSDKVVLQKHKDNVTVEDKLVKLQLTQEETFMFEADNEIKIHVRVLTEEGHVPDSDILFINCEDCLSEEVLK